MKKRVREISDRENITRLYLWKIKNEVGEKCKITDVEKYKTFFTTSPKIFLKDVIKSCILITCAVLCTYYLFLCFVSIYIFWWSVR